MDLNQFLQVELVIANFSIFPQTRKTLKFSFLGGIISPMNKTISNNRNVAIWAKYGRLKGVYKWML